MRNHSTIPLALVVIAWMTRCDTDISTSNWSNYLGDKKSSQYSALDQVNLKNVKNLQVAWTYQSGDADPENRSQIQCNPIIIDGVLYGSSPALKFFALDAATGQELWRFDPFSGDYNMFGMGVNRGLVYWTDGRDSRILCTAGSTLFSLDATTGKPVTTFGLDGRVDLHEGLGDRAKELFVTANSPGVLWKDLLILGTRVSESLPAAPGYIRAFDVRTGEIAWVFKTIPDPGEPGYDTWPEDAYQRIGGANGWSGMSLDEETGTVFVPTGSASFDFWGGDRHGENLFANCVLALDASTGKRKWHYQTVHHDIWDRDLPAPPNLLTVEHEGQKINALAQITKSAFVFLFNRDTGEPLFPIEEMPFAQSDLKGEKAHPTQPIPTKPPPFARQVFTEDLITDISPESNTYVKSIFKTVRAGDRFIPPSTEGTVIFPGFDGGGEWGGAAHDPERGILYVNANEMPWILTMVELFPDQGDVVLKGRNIYARSCANCHGMERQGGSFMGNVPELVNVFDRLSTDEVLTQITNGKGVMPGFAYLNDQQKDALIQFLKQPPFDMASPDHIDRGNQSQDAYYGHTGYNKFLDQNGYPAVKPPWGTLSAIDLNQGEILWQVVLGEHADLVRQGLPPTGSENYGGPVATAGGLLFIAATLDGKIRAFNRETGEEVWRHDLPAPGFATPATYMVEGKQYVVIACGGGKLGTKSGDAYVAFALP